MKIYTSQKRYI